MATLDYGDSTALHAILEDLPQEMFDDIYRRTFSATTAAEQSLITTAGLAHYNIHLELLRVDRASRAQYARSYFRSRTFVTDHSSWIEWLKSLAAEHRVSLLNIEIRLNESPEYAKLSDAIRKSMHDHYHGYVISTLRAQFGEDLAGRLHVEICHTLAPSFVPSRPDGS
ncbi:uncharacterized protein MYCGRDRAFT_95745 [Zymoseptoria tritici IPO323]|uniref:Uncharacterized protein n=1 Tax=Zymoseptoria tritici (strain CBS 115943 / IPO323) TaxID=336722 RepID=F9XKB2_ZYMTI|nr:uncharacterized protein MYCGRDRAFT_95745 [Zymoseptoria tritici IPO323]EGP84383.1 hypothetical protein MYCGRDRAFT_95745 [Zymoseptoria tritici IPO323]